MVVEPEPIHLLLLDDSASVREVLRFALESEGYRVLEASDGREGVRLFHEHRPALVIADIVMPEKDGLETVRDILAIDPAAMIFTMSCRDEDYQEVAVRRVDCLPYACLRRQDEGVPRGGRETMESDPNSCVSGE